MNNSQVCCHCDLVKPRVKNDKFELRNLNNLAADLAPILALFRLYTKFNNGIISRIFIGQTSFTLSPSAPRLPGSPFGPGGPCGPASPDLPQRPGS